MAAVRILAPTRREKVKMSRAVAPNPTKYSIPATRNNAVSSFLDIGKLFMTHNFLTKNISRKNLIRKLKQTNRVQFFSYEKSIEFLQKEVYKSFASINGNFSQFTAVPLPMKTSKSATLSLASCLWPTLGPTQMVLSFL